MSLSFTPVAKKHIYIPSNISYYKRHRTKTESSPGNVPQTCMRERNLILVCKGLPALALATKSRPKSSNQVSFPQARDTRANAGDHELDGKQTSAGDEDLDGLEVAGSPPCSWVSNSLPALRREANREALTGPLILLTGAPHRGRNSSAPPVTFSLITVRGPMAALWPGSGGFIHHPCSFQLQSSNPCLSDL